jgi:hypothetical protein
MALPSELITLLSPVLFPTAVTAEQLETILTVEGSLVTMEASIANCIISNTCWEAARPQMALLVQVRRL